jgi:hypothetical protein
MEDAITFGILKAVAILCAGYVAVLVTLGVLRIVSRYLSVIVAIAFITATIIWMLKTEPFGPLTSEYLIAVPVLCIGAFGALALLYEGLMKLEKLWDRALAARRYRKLRATPPWGARPPQS